MSKWSSVALHEVCVMYQPKTISGKDLVAGGAYPVYGANGRIGFYDHFNHTDSEVTVTCRGATCGTVNVIPGPSWITGNAMVVRPRNEDILKSYLARALRTIDYSTVITGAAQPQITRAKLEHAVIPLPPITEQRRIAAILHKADEVQTKRRAALEALETLAEAVFIEMFGDLVTNPKGWKSQYVGDLLAQPLRNGVSPSTAGAVVAEVLTLSAITGARFQSTAVKTAPFEKSPDESRRVQAADFLMCRGNGNLRLVGRGHFAPADMPDVVFPDTMIAARFDGSQITPLNRPGFHRDSVVCETSVLRCRSDGSSSLRSLPAGFCRSRCGCGGC